MIAALLLAQAVVAGPALDAGPAGEIVKLGWDGRAKVCTAQVHGAEVGDPRTDAGQAALLAVLPDPEKLIHLIGTGDAPFLCLQGVVDTLGSHGRRFRIGFAATSSQPER